VESVISLTIVTVCKLTSHPWGGGSLKFKILSFVANYGYTISVLDWHTPLCLTHHCCDWQNIFDYDIWGTHCTVAEDVTLLGEQFAAFHRIVVPSNCWELLTQWHSVTPRKTCVFIFHYRGYTGIMGPVLCNFSKFFFKKWTHLGFTLIHFHVWSWDSTVSVVTWL